jgi:small subunit ribosomal protein S20
MPNHKSAEKRDRQNARRNSMNTASRSRLRGQIRKLRAALAAGQTDEINALLPETISIIDKAVQKGVIHRNAAARHKSRLTVHVNESKTK